MRIPGFRGLHHGVRSILASFEAALPQAEPLAPYVEPLARCAGLASTSRTVWPPPGSGGLAPWHVRAASTSTAAPSPAAAALKKGSGKRQGAALEDDPSLIRVVLRKDVKGLGQRGEVVSVKRGLMRHELYPRGQAAYATPENVAKYAVAEAKRATPAEDASASLEKLLKALSKKAVVVMRRAADSDPERFAEPPVSSRHIREAVQRQLGIRLHSSHLLLDGKIDSYGSFKVPMNLRLKDDRQVELTVHVDRSGMQAGSAAASTAAAASSRTA